MPILFGQFFSLGLSFKPPNIKILPVTKERFILYSEKKGFWLHLCQLSTPLSVGNGIAPRGYIH